MLAYLSACFSCAYFSWTSQALALQLFPVDFISGIGLQTFISLRKLTICLQYLSYCRLFTVPCCILLKQSCNCLILGFLLFSVHRSITSFTYQYSGEIFSFHLALLLVHCISFLLYLTCCRLSNLFTVFIH